MDRPLTGKTVVLGISGSVAAYRGAEVARRLMDLGADVEATLTRAGAQFITPLTLRSLTGNPVTVDMFEEPREWDIKHVALAQRAAAIVVAPATADAIAKLALGIADEFLFALALATRAPVFVAPAMNGRMLAHPALRQNLATLRERGVHIIEPEAGRLACGEVGQGRLADPERIAAAVVEALGRSGDLAGARVLVTAGPTREPLDPVRFISNRSSGRMGYALAEAAAARGAGVTLVSGPSALAPPEGCEIVRVETTEEMRRAVIDRFPDCEILIAAAAPADFRPAKPAGQKVRKSEQPPALELEPTPDILAECGRLRAPGHLLVGFAAETENLLQGAERKLREKNLDIIVANEVGGETGFDSDRNAGHIIFADGRSVALPAMDKRGFAERVLDAVAEARRRSAVP